MWGFGALLYEIWSLGCKPFEDMENNEVRAFTQSITIRQTTYIHAREAHNHGHIRNFTTGDQPRPNWLSLTPSTWVPKSNVLSNDILLVRMSLIYTYVHYCSARVPNICMWCSELMPTQPCSTLQGNSCQLKYTMHTGCIVLMSPSTCLDRSYEYI